MKKQSFGHLILPGQPSSSEYRLREVCMSTVRRLPSQACSTPPNPGSLHMTCAAACRRTPACLVPNGHARNPRYALLSPTLSRKRARVQTIRYANLMLKR